MFSRVSKGISAFPTFTGTRYQSQGVRGTSTGSADSCPTRGPLRALPFALPRSPPAPCPPSGLLLSRSVTCCSWHPLSPPAPPGIPFLSLPCPPLVLLPFTCENTSLSLFLRKVPGRWSPASLPRSRARCGGSCARNLGKTGFGRSSWPGGGGGGGCRGEGWMGLGQRLG